MELLLSNVPDKKERTKRKEHVRMQKRASQLSLLHFRLV